MTTRKTRKKQTLWGKSDKSLTKFVVFSFASLIIYTIVSQIIFCKTSVEMTVLTKCFFIAFGGECVTCAVIKIFKLTGVKNERDNYSETDI